MIFAGPALSSAIEVNREDFFARRGFDVSWTKAVPGRDDHNWLLIPGTSSSLRPVVLKELPLEGIPVRMPFSLRHYPARDFTFVTSFSLSEADLAPGKYLGMLFDNIGENWAVYVNGHLLKSEIHLDAGGGIAAYRHWRDVLVPIDPRYLVEGRNVAAIRIIADPTNLDGGFHRSTPFVIDDLDELERHRSERATLVLIFLYLFFGFYHLFLFAIRPAEKSYLYYGIFSALLFVYLLSRTHSIYDFVADSTLLHRVEYCSLYMLLPAFGAFIDSLLIGRIGRVTKAFSVFYGILIAVTAAPVTNTFALDVLRVWQVSALFPLVYFSIVRIAGPVRDHFLNAYHHDTGLAAPRRFFRALAGALTGSTAGNLVIGTLFMLVCAILDIADSLFWAFNFMVIQYGFFMFTMGITLVLANRFVLMHRQLQRSTDIMQNEIELAGQIQQALLTKTPSPSDAWDIAVSYEPKYGASGDMYDFYQSDGRLRGVALFDVSGHGISSALLTMIVKPITFRTFNAMKDADLDAVLESVNGKISEELEHIHNFISCVLLRFSGNAVQYVNAGHPDLFHLKLRTGRVTVVGSDMRKFRGRPLGVDSGSIDSFEVQFNVRKGDILLLYTDCLIEGKNEHREQYGPERLIRSLETAPEGPAAAVLDHILKEFLAFTEKGSVNDDRTVIVMKRRS